MERLSMRQLLFFQCVLVSVTVVAQYHLSVSDVTSTGFRVQWSQSEEEISQSSQNEVRVRIEEEGGDVRLEPSERKVYNDLLPDTTYKVSLVPSSSVSPLSNVENVRTLCGVPSPPVLSLRNLSWRSPRKANFSVKIPPKQEWKCRNITVYLESEKEGQWQQEIPLNPSETDFEVDNLIPCSVCKYRIKLSNDQETVVSDITSFQAHADKLPSVQNVSIAANGKERLVVTWSPPLADNNSCSVNQYKVRYWQVSSKACDPQKVVPFKYSKRTRRPAVTIDNLESYSEYTVAVSPMVKRISSCETRCGFIDGETTTVSMITQPDAPEKKPSDVLLTGVTLSSLTFSWKQGCTEHNGAIVGFQYELSNDGGEVVENGTTDMSSATIRGLTGNTRYHFKVSARNSVGSGPFTTPVMATTRDRPPTCPGKSPIRIGGILRRTGAGGDPIGSSTPVFMALRQKNPFKKRRGILKIDVGRSQNCEAAPSTTNCQADPPNMCPTDGGPTDSSQCDAACPRFLNSTRVFNIEKTTNKSRLLLTWRDWDMKLDEGLGPVTGYLLRYGKEGETNEVQKGLTLQHQFDKPEISTKYFFNITLLRSTSSEYNGLCDESYQMERTV